MRTSIVSTGMCGTRPNRGGDRTTGGLRAAAASPAVTGAVVGA